MKMNLRPLGACAALAFLISCSSAPTPAPTTDAAPVAEDEEYFPSYGPMTVPHAPAGAAMVGINLGNTLDAVPNEGSWTAGVLAQERYFDDFAAAGFNFVRIPVTWSSHAGDKPPYTIEPAFMERVAQVVQWALDRKLTVVLNCHHEVWLFKDYAAKIGRLDALWQQIAQRFQKADDHLVFEIMNEPYGEITDAQVNDMNQRELNVIRKTNPLRRVVVGPNSYNAFTKLPAMVLPTVDGHADAHLIATFHYYNPWDFAGNAIGTWGTPEDVRMLESDFETVKRWSHEHGDIPMLLGEYGAAQQHQGLIADIRSRLAWYKTATSAARKQGFWYSAWDDYGNFGIFGRLDDTFEDGLLGAIFGQ